MASKLYKWRQGRRELEIHPVLFLEGKVALISHSYKIKAIHTVLALSARTGPSMSFMDKYELPFVPIAHSHTGKDVDVSLSISLISPRCLLSLIGRFVWAKWLTRDIGQQPTTYT